MHRGRGFRSSAAAPSKSLVEALEGDKNPIRARVMPLLAMIQDPRGRQALIAMLLDRNPRMRLIAVRCLARFPSADTVAALNRLLDRGRRESMRIAAVHSLVEQYAAGQDQAIRQGSRSALRSPASNRRFAWLPFRCCGRCAPSQQRSILKRLHQDPSDEIREPCRQVRIGRRSPRPSRSWPRSKGGCSTWPPTTTRVWNAAAQLPGRSFGEQCRQAPDCRDRASAATTLSSARAPEWSSNRSAAGATATSATRWTASMHRSRCRRSSRSSAPSARSL